MNSPNSPQRPKHLRYRSGACGGRVANGLPRYPGATAEKAVVRPAESEALANERDARALARFFRTVLKT